MPFLILLLSGLLIAADQIVKYFIDLQLKPIETVEIIKGFFSLDYLENRGAALGILQDQRWIFITLTVIICLAMIIFLFLYKSHTTLSYITTGLLLAGGVGNLIDRISRGYVIDYIYFHFFPYKFNLADCYVTVGAVLFAVAVLAYEKKQRKAERKDEDV